MDDLLQDVRFGLRLLWKQKTLSLTAALTLAVCLAANVAVFGAANNTVGVSRQAALDQWQRSQPTRA